jgi:hypothetical protein
LVQRPSKRRSNQVQERDIGRTPCLSS